jgi:putative Holliday junction resolvase
MAIIPLKELKTHLPRGKRLMGIDHGEKTLGLALSNPDLTIATPFKTIQRTKFTQDIVTLAKICSEYEVFGFVIGLPLNMDGTEGPRVQSVKHFSDNLLKATEALGFEPLIAFFDERLSTYAAEQSLIDDLDMRRDKRKAVIDAAAAAHILKGALEKITQ